MDNKSILGNLAGWLFGILVLAIGLLNTFWGNDPQYGIFLILLSFVFYPPANVLFQKITGFSIHYILKILLGLFIIWTALGVGELFHKIHLMLMDLT